jgi:hypothetical protein
MSSVKMSFVKMSFVKMSFVRMSFVRMSFVKRMTYSGVECDGLFIILQAQFKQFSAEYHSEACCSADPTLLKRIAQSH